MNNVEFFFFFSGLVSCLSSEKCLFKSFAHLKVVVSLSVELSELYILDTKLYQINMVCKYFFHFSGLSFYFLDITLGSIEFLIVVTIVSPVFPCCLSFGCCEMSGFGSKAQGSLSSLVMALSLSWYSLMRHCHRTSLVL